MSNGAPETSMRHTRADVDLDALRHNVAQLRAAADDSELWAVVKANAYGHGAVPCATAALGAGAAGLCVALTQEVVELRKAGITAPIMVLSEQPINDLPVLVRHGAVCVAYNEHYLAALADVARREQTVIQVHLKVDTGMHRVGVSPDQSLARAKTVAASSHLVLDGVMTHLATADDPAHTATELQLNAFRHVIADLRAAGLRPRHIHVANSAATMRRLVPECTMVRAGIAMYGLLPGEGVAHFTAGLRPVMSLRTRITHVQRLRAGEGVSYGLRTVLDRDTTVATLPLGYADGIARRAWETPARVLVGGKSRRIVGVVTMDQMMVDCGDDAVSIGDEAVVFGEQAGSTVRVEDWARALGTISYEVVCAVSSRVPRVYHGS